MRKYLVAAVALLAATACMNDAPTGPRMAGRGRASASTSLSSRETVPGERLTAQMVSGQLTPLNCIPSATATGSMTIGAEGGELVIGTHRLVIPPGAVDKRILITGTVPEGKPFEIQLEPHGLQFRKAAGLVLDASSCTEVPDIVYLIDQVNVSEPIEATYSSWWKTIACPIWHFSGYAIAFSDESGDAAILR